MRTRIAVVILLCAAVAGCGSESRRNVSAESRTEQEYFFIREFLEFPLGILKFAGGVVMLPVGVISPPPYMDGMNLLINWIDSSITLMNPVVNDAELWGFSPPEDAQVQRDLMNTVRKFEDPDYSRILE